VLVNPFGRAGRPQRRFVEQWQARELDASRQTFDVDARGRPQAPIQRHVTPRIGEHSLQLRLGNDRRPLRRCGRIGR
jgi:hypothetical protein